MEAVRQERFHVWAIERVEEGIELLTGVPAGTRGPDGRFPEGTVFARVEATLKEFTERARSLQEGEDKKKGG